MRKILLATVLLVLIIFSVWVVIYGIEFRETEIYSFKEIENANYELDKKIEAAASLQTLDYPQNLATLEQASKNLETKKQEYEELLALGVDENGLPLNKIQEYEIEKIWVTMGNYAKKQGVDLKMDITLNNSVSQTYNLNFTLTGGYIQITDFLYDIERDTTLVFKLENFKMVPGSSTDDLSATFVCRDIKLNIKGSESTSTSTGTTATGITDTTSTTSTTNTTNSTGTTSSTGN